MKTRPHAPHELAVFTLLACLTLAAIIVPLCTQLIEHDVKDTSWTPINKDLSQPLGGHRSSGYGGIASLDISSDGKRIVKTMYYNDKTPETLFHTTVWQYAPVGSFQRPNQFDYLQLGQALPGIYQSVLPQKEPVLQSTSMSGDGSTVAIGHPFGTLERPHHHDETKPFQHLHTLGLVQVFRLNEATLKWDTLGNNIDPEVLPWTKNQYSSSNFGISTSLSTNGRRIAVGVTHVQYIDDTKNSSSSLVQVLDLSNDNTTWLAAGTPIEGICDTNTGCTPCHNNTNQEATFGQTVSLSHSGNRLAIAATQEGCSNRNTNGFVRVLDWNNSHWKPVGQDITLPELQHSNESRLLGHSLSLAGNGRRLAVGSNAGAAVLELSLETNEWKILGTPFVYHSKYHMEGNEGASVSLSNHGRRVAISAPFGNKKGQGMAQVYQWNHITTNKQNYWEWEPLGRALEQPDDDWYARDVALASEAADILSVASDWYAWAYKAPKDSEK